MKKNKYLIIVGVCFIFFLLLILFPSIIPRKLPIEILTNIERGDSLSLKEIVTINHFIVSFHAQECIQGISALSQAYSHGSIKNLTPVYLSLAEKILRITQKKEYKNPYVDHIEFFLRSHPSKEMGDLLRMFYHGRYTQFKKDYPIEKVVETVDFLNSLKTAKFDYLRITEMTKNHDPYAVIPIFSLLLSHDVPMIRYCAANILGWFKDERSCFVLKEAIKNLHPVITKKYKTGKYNYGLDDDTLSIFQDAIKRIGEIGYDCGVAKLLVEVAVDTILESEIRKSAIFSLMALKIPVETISQKEIEPGHSKYRYKITIENKEYFTVIR